MDKTKYQYEGMKWIVELELLNDPQVLNTLKFNILMASKHIKEVELLIYRENKSMLVLLDVTWIGRRFFQKRINSEVEDVLTQLLPSFRFRVTQDPKIMKMAIDLVKTALTGGKNENDINPSKPISSDPTQQPTIVGATSPSENTGAGESNQSDQQEQPKADEAIQNQSGTDDSTEKQKA